MHFILSFEYHVFNAWGLSVRPKYVACVDEANKSCYGWRQHICDFITIYHKGMNFTRKIYYKLYRKFFCPRELRSSFILLTSENKFSHWLCYQYCRPISRGISSYIAPQWTDLWLTLILRCSRTGTVWFYTSTSNKRAARPKLYSESLTRDLKLMYSRLTLVRISINL